GEGMEHPCVGHANEWAAQCVVGKPLRQFPGGEPLDQMLLDREVKAQGVAVYEHETWPPEAVVEDERDDAENRRHKPCRRLEPGRESHAPLPVRPSRHRACASIPVQRRTPAKEAQVPTFRSGVW